MVSRNVVWSSLLVGLGLAGDLGAQSVVSAFQGSVERGVYEAEFDALFYPTSLERGAKAERVEGAIRSRLLQKPRERSNLEVYRSYQRELEAAGFTTVISAARTPMLSFRIWEMYQASDAPLGGRRYQPTGGRASRTDIAWVERFVEYYLVARRTQGDGALYVAILISKEHDLYLIDELTTAAMAEGTVTLDLDAMRAALAQTGKVAIYGIHFAIVSASIEPSSASTLTEIGKLLAETPGRFYIVGHTDDTGALDDNLRLSERRAGAVLAALVADHGVAADRLETRGVGPLAPVGSNADEAGRQLNRRVEIVRRLP
ncbi:MAG: OmpA family protein [Gemmatimonadales bacterium]